MANQELLTAESVKSAASLFNILVKQASDITSNAAAIQTNLTAQQISAAQMLLDLAHTINRKLAASVQKIGASAGLYSITDGDDAGQVWERLADGTLQRRSDLEAAPKADITELNTALETKQLSEPINYASYSDMLSGTSTSLRHLSGGYIFDLLPAADQTAVDGGVVVQRQDGRKLRRRGIQGEVYARWWGFGLQEDPKANKQALQAAFDYCRLNKISQLVLEEGDNHVYPGLLVSSNLRIVARGVRRIIRNDQVDASQATVPLLTIVNGEKLNDPLGQSIGGNARGGLVGIIFANQNARIGYGIQFGDDGGEATAGSHYPVEGCTFNGFDRAEVYKSNVWLIKHYNCCYDSNNTDIYNTAGGNAGENMTWDGGVSTNCYDCPVVIEGNAGTGYKFINFSFDYTHNTANKFVARFAGSNASLELVNCWIEGKLSGELFREEGNGAGTNRVFIRGGSWINTCPDADSQVMTSTYGLKIDTEGLQYIKRTGQGSTKCITGSRTLNIDPGQTNGFIEVPYNSDVCVPRVLATNNQGISWRILLAPDRTGSGRDYRVFGVQLTSPAPTGGCQFVVTW